MWGMLTEILRLSTGSVVWGVLIALAVMALLVLIVRGWRRDAAFTPVAYAVGTVVTLLLMFQCTMTVGALKIINMADDCEAIVQHLVDNSNISLDSKVTTEQAGDIASRLADQIPLLRPYISGEWSVGTTLREMPHAVAEQLRSSMRSYIVRRLLWSLAFAVVFVVVAAMTVETSGQSFTRHAPPSRSDSGRTRSVGSRAKSTRVSRRRR